MCTAKPHTRYKEALLALENVCVQVSCIQRTRKKCVLARKLIGLSILHINMQERQLYLTILHTNSCTNFTSYITYIPPHYIKLKYFMNLRDKDNLRRKDKSAVPKVSFLRRFHCNYNYKRVGRLIFSTNISIHNNLKVDKQ